MWIIGIDPGVSGALVMLNDERQLEAMIDMPVETVTANKQRVATIDLGDWLRRSVDIAAHHGHRVTVMIEKVGAMPGNGNVSMFNFGDSAGCLRGATGALGMAVQFVTPQKWKRAACCINEEKDYARTLARQMYPDAELHLKKHGGRADAIHIALFGFGVRTPL